MLLDLLISVRYSRDCKDGKISELSDFSQPLKPYAATLDRKHSKDSISVHSPPSLFADEPGELPFDEKFYQPFEDWPICGPEKDELEVPHTPWMPQNILKKGTLFAFVLSHHKDPNWEFYVGKVITIRPRSRFIRFYGGDKYDPNKPLEPSVWKGRSPGNSLFCLRILRSYIEFLIHS